MAHFERIQLVSPELLTAINGHKGFFGQSGSGKSCAAEFDLTSMIGRYKCLDAWNGGFEEGLTYSLPQSEPPMVERIHELSCGRLAPKGFDTQIIAFSGKLLKYEKDVPANFEIYSLDPEDLTVSDFSNFLGKSDSSRSVLAWIEYKHPDMTLLELEEYLNTTSDKQIPAQSKNLLLRQIGRLLGSGLFDTKYPHLDLKETLKETNRLTSFQYGFLEDEAKAICAGLLLKRILNLKRSKTVRNKIALYIRECHDFYSEDSPGMEFPGGLLEKIARQGRRLGVDLIVDSQRLVDVPPGLRKNLGSIFMLKSDQSEAFALRNVRFVPDPVVFKIPNLKKGEGVGIGASGYCYPMFFFPPLHQNSSAGLDSIRLLKKVYGKKEISLLELDNTETLDSQRASQGLTKGIADFPAPEKTGGGSANDFRRM